MKKFLAILTVLSIMFVSSQVFANAGVIYAPPLTASGQVQTQPDMTFQKEELGRVFYGNQSQIVANVDTLFNVVPVIENSEIGLERLTYIMKQKGNNATMTNLTKINDTTWTCTIKSDKWWQNGQWLLTLQQSVPDMTQYKNAYWYGLYSDPQKNNRLGYILAVKQ